MGEKQQSLGRLAADIALSTFFTEINHIQNFGPAKEHLEQNRGSVLLYANHFHRLDSVVIGKVINGNIAQLNNKISVMVSKQYTDGEREENKQIVKALGLLQKAYGFNFISVVQEKPEEKEQYPNWERINKEATRRAIELLRMPGNMVCVMPEGTRSETGTLIQALRGFEIIMKRGGPNVLVQPLAVTHTDIKPLQMRTQIFVPESFTYEQILEEQRQNPQFDVTTLAMRRIARELKPQNQGPYRLDF